MSTQNSEKREIKIVLLSDPGTGVKTSLAARYVDDMFEKETVPTLGVNMRRKTVTVDGTEATLMIWDTPGEERFRDIVSAYLRGAHAVIVGFDVTRAYTLHGCDRWIEHFARNKVQHVVVAVGNKIDCVGEREVSHEEAVKHFAEMKPPVPYYETSAKTSEGVQKLFEDVIGMVVEGYSFGGQNENTNEDTQQGGRPGKCIVC